MAKLWQPYRLALPVVALLLVLAASAPLVSMHNGCPVTSSCTSALGSECKSSAETAKDTAKPQQKKSVLDSDALDKPITFFKDIISSERNEDEESEIAPQAGTIVLALKALAATLLSTII